ncbi:unnamed protein product [Staurois parvus]|uniref:Uncharacterized protein n=1 Tax=Staurois parvus TaxID=386267 RepID=A0ABN9FQE0_9NEOB|nr:unnamed protein product [Staurois parvus]
MLGCFHTEEFLKCFCIKKMPEKLKKNISLCMTSVIGSSSKQDVTSDIIVYYV